MEQSEDIQKNISRILAVMSQGKPLPKFPENVVEERIDIAFFNSDGKTVSRPIKLFRHINIDRPEPLIFQAHYEIQKNSVELVRYLNENWAVASVSDFDDLYNAQLLDDDLIFNNAALFYLMKRSDIDHTRIAVTGGSAGGYMTLMLNGLRLGICCCVARSALVNIPFNFQAYSPYVDSINCQVMPEITADDWKDLPRLLSVLPIPFAAVFHLFATYDTVKHKDYTGKSPIDLASRFSAPFIETHNTSDILVPVDQITKRYTYKTQGKSLSEDFKYRLEEFDLPSYYYQSLEEVLPEEEIAFEYTVIDSDGIDFPLPFDKDKRYNIDIFDEGAPESYSNHGKYISGIQDDIPYIRYCFTKARGGTNALSLEKTAELIRQFAGLSKCLPVNSHAPDVLYGSRASYQQQVLLELQGFVEDNGFESLAVVLKKTSNYYPELEEYVSQILKQMNS